MVDPPLVEGAIGSYIEALFWGGALANAFETSDPKMSRFSTAAIA